MTSDAVEPVGAGRLRLRAGAVDVPAMRRGSARLAVAREDAARLPGLVELWEGDRQIARCLIVASEEFGGEVTFELKRASWARNAAPADYAGDESSA